MKGSSFKYFGSVINEEGSITECVKDSIQTGNRAYLANQRILKSNIIKRSVEMQIYKMTSCNVWI
jgi:hypothetical protein